ncbi:M28 family peptidase [Allonocardiopsis opalescens]|nr:M28 family peptidase [Allonocardiopsis opalescens]
MAPTAQAEPADAGRLPRLVNVNRIEGHLDNLATIADYNGGNRATGTPGYQVAAQYVIDQLERAGYEPEVHEYDYESWSEVSPSEIEQVAPEQVAYEYGTDFLTFTYSVAGEVTAPVVPVNTGAADSGCTAEQFAGFPEGAIALIRRGSCTFQIKTDLAAQAGASAAIIFNSGGAPEFEQPVLGTVGGLSEIPVVGTSNDLGEALAATEGLELRVAVDSVVETRSSFNVVAETETGRHDNVVVVGAHLDSVREGAGINDNGSGVATVLEIARQLPRLNENRLNNAVRFAFWGTEEEGLIGSTEYVQSLSEEQIDDIALYLNFDMVGSPNYARFVLDGDDSLGGSITPPPAGSGAIETLFHRYFDAQGMVSEDSEFNGRSDYSGFINAGIPSGGLFSGAEGVKTEEQVEWYGGTAGESYDPNYHTAADDLDNINRQSLDELSDAAAYAVETYARSTLPVNGVLRTAQATAPAQFERQGDLFLR